MRKAVGFIRARRAAFTRWRVSSRQRAVHRQHIGSAGRPRPARRARHQARGATAGDGVWIIGDEFHVEGLGQAEQLGADIADAERAQGATDEAVRPYAGRARSKPAGPSRVRRSLIISLPVSASIRVMIETATGRRTPSGRDDQRDAGRASGPRHRRCHSRRRSGRRRRAGHWGGCCRR